MIPDFTDNEIASIHDMLTNHYRKDVEINLADSDVLLTPDDDGPTACPAVFWHAREANFVVIKTGDSRFRTRFFYTPHDQFSTDVSEFTSVDDCVAAVLHSHSAQQSGQAEAQSSGTESGLN